MKEFKYDIALSFAGENREYVEELASHLRTMDVNVFYDKFEAASLWGTNLYSYLSDIYSKKARYCIIFISEHYAKKQWTNLERESAQERAFAENEEYILPVRFDQTELPGLKKTIGYLNANEYSPIDVGNLLLEKLGKKRNTLRNQAQFIFTSTQSFDFKLLLESLSYFKGWDPVNRAEKLPIKVILPFDIIQRIDSYRTILESIQPSNEIPETTINDIKKIYSEEYINEHFIYRIEDFIRKLYNLYLDKVISLEEFEDIIKIYCLSKVVNYIRNILAYRLKGTEDEDWLFEYYNLSGEWWSSLMSGLPYTLKKEFDLPVFLLIQIDIVERSSNLVNPLYYRKEFYIPDTLLENAHKVKNVSSIRTDILRCLIPQIFEYNIRYEKKISLWNFIKFMDNYKFDIRGEWFYRGDNFKQVGQNWEIKELKEKLELKTVDNQLKAILTELL